MNEAHLTGFTTKGIWESGMVDDRTIISMIPPKHPDARWFS